MTTTAKKQNLSEKVGNSRENMARFGRKLLGGIKKAGYWLLQILGFILIVLIGILIWTLTLVFMNPIVLWILGFICPKWVVRETHEWCKRFDDLGLDLYWETFRGVFDCLPWYARKHYIDYAVGFNYCEDKDQIRFFMEMSPKEREENAKYLNSTVKKFFWKNHPQMRFLLINCITFNVDRFEDLLYPLDKELLNAYIKSHPSLNAEYVLALRNRLDSMISKHQDSEVYSDDEKYLYHVLYSQVEKNGATEGILANLGACTPYVFHCITTALEDYAHRQAVLSSQNDLVAWKKYCDYLFRFNKPLPAKAQAEMTVDQYMIYHGAGLKLHSYAIVCIVSKDNGRADGLAATIFRNEEFEMTPAINAVLCSRPFIRQLFVEAAVGKSEDLNH